MNTENFCPNLSDCKLIHSELVVTNYSKREIYIENYCKSILKYWNKCTRYQTFKTLHFCPQFVLPDTQLSIDEILDQFEELETN